MLEIFNDSDDSEGSFDDTRTNNVIRIDLLDDAMQSSQNPSASEYSSNLEIKILKSEAPHRMPHTQSMIKNSSLGRSRGDSGKIESKIIKENSDKKDKSVISKQLNTLILWFRNTTNVIWNPKPVIIRYPKPVILAPNED